MLAKTSKAVEKRCTGFATTAMPVLPLQIAWKPGLSMEVFNHLIGGHALGYTFDSDGRSQASLTQACRPPQISMMTMRMDMHL